MNWALKRQNFQVPYTFLQVPFIRGLKQMLTLGIYIDLDA